MPTYQVPAQTYRPSDITQLRDGASLDLEGTISVIKPEQLSIPSNVHSIHWQNGPPRSLMSPEEVWFTYTGKFNLHKRALNDPSFPKYIEPETLKDCVDYLVKDEKGILILVVGTDSPLRATEDGKFEARMLYQGNVTDSFFWNPQDAHIYELLTNQGRVVFSVELPNKSNSV